MALDLDEFKEKWKTVNLRLDKLEENNERLAARLATSRATTAQQKLARTYFLTGIVAFLLPVMSPSLVSVLDLPVWVAVVYAVFGVVMGIANICISKYISRCDYLSMPVVEALRHAVKIQQIQRTGRLAAIIVSVLIISLLGFHLLSHEDPYITVSFVIGLVTGLALGIVKCLKMLRLAKQIQQELRSIQENDNE